VNRRARLRRTTRKEKLSRLATEQVNPLATDLDTKPALEIARIINSEDATVAKAVRGALPQIARAINWAANAIAEGGRLIYVGAGTSGRIAALDAAECPPTYGADPRSVQFVMAGGKQALGAAIEADEDSPDLGVREIRKKRPGKKDVVVGIAASGRTPFTVAAIQYARTRAAKTIAITSNRRSPLQRAAELAILVETGPEVVSGSTRMKAGTAQKMVLNMISTGAMVRIGYVYGSLMVKVHPKNVKLTERGITILERATGVSRDQAEAILRHAAGSIPAALVMLKAGVNRKQAEKALIAADGHIRGAVTRASTRQTRQD
jgi:N-acetylmuramic acid 6-phosphate etherase